MEVNRSDLTPKSGRRICHFGCKVEVRQTGHERVTEATEVCNIPHLLGKDVAYVVLASNMRHADGLVLDSLTHQVLPELNVAYSLEHHVARPENIDTVVVEYLGGTGNVAGSWNPASFKPACEVTGSNGEFAAHVCCIDFSFTGAERCLREKD